MSVKIGAHMSISGGLDKSFKRSYELGANIFQIFAKSPRGWNFGIDKLDEDTIKLSKENFKNFDQKWGIIHSVYLVNLAKPFDQSEKDIKSVLDDFEIAEKIGLNGVNVHLGKYGEIEKQEAINNMTENVGYILENIKNKPVYFIFENTAGQGSEIGWDFGELGYFYNSLKEKFGKELIENKILFCIDTAHAWGAGYDLINWKNVLNDFDKNIGTDKIYCFHLNDSKVPLGSKLDRHASLGKGFIGIRNLSDIIRWASENDKPMIMETPDDNIRSQEIEMVKSIANYEFTTEEIEKFHSKNFKTQYLKKFEDLAKGGLL